MPKRATPRPGTGRRSTRAAAIQPMAPPTPAQPQRLLVKLRNGNAVALGADSRANVRPLFDRPPAPGRELGFGAEPQWFIADMADGADTPWDLAHARVAAQLGVDESDVIFAEPDLVHDVFPDETAAEGRPGLAVGASCGPIPQNGANGQAVGPHDGWHLDDAFSQLAGARAEVTFAAPRTRVAHLDTGYYAKHITLPRHL